MAPAPYTTPEKVRSLVARGPASRPGTGASIAESQVIEAIEAAHQRIDSNLGSVYSVPFDPVLPLITDIATAIAAFELDLTFRETRDYQSELNPVVFRYKEMKAELEKLRSGAITLPGYVAPENPVEPPDNPHDGGSIGEPVNQPLVDFDNCRTTWMDHYYGWRS